MMEYRVFVTYRDGSFCYFVVLSFDEIYDTIGSFKNVSAVNIFCEKE